MPNLTQKEFKKYRPSTLKQAIQYSQLYVAYDGVDAMMKRFSSEDYIKEAVSEIDKVISTVETKNNCHYEAEQQKKLRSFIIAHFIDELMDRKHGIRIVSDFFKSGNRTTRFYEKMYGAIDCFLKGNNETVKQEKIGCCC